MRDVYCCGNVAHATALDAYGQAWELVAKVGEQIMDLVRSWLISAAVLLGVDFVINVVVGQHLSAPYLLGPFLAGVASTLYHLSLIHI